MEFHEKGRLPLLARSVAVQSIIRCWNLHDLPRLLSFLFLFIPTAIRNSGKVQRSVVLNRDSSAVPTLDVWVLLKFWL